MDLLIKMRFRALLTNNAALLTNISALLNNNAVLLTNIEANMINNEAMLTNNGVMLIAFIKSVFMISGALAFIVAGSLDDSISGSKIFWGFVIFIP